MKIKVEGYTALIEIYCDYLGRYLEVPEDVERDGAFWVSHDTWHRYKTALAIVEQSRVIFEQCYNAQVPPCNTSPML